MPTREVLASFWRDWDRLTPQQQRAFREALVQFIAGIADGGQSFHPRLRVKRVQGHPGLWEMTWAPDGRATFEYGPEVRAGEAHVTWRHTLGLSTALTRIGDPPCYSALPKDRRPPGSEARRFDLRSVGSIGADLQRILGCVYDGGRTITAWR